MRFLCCLNGCWALILVLLLISVSSSSRVKRGNGPKKVPLSLLQIEEILDTHNKLRASISSSNMRYMTWDGELASISQKYGTKCQFSHNTEGKHSKFQNSIGENIFVSRTPVATFGSARAIQLWFNEKTDFDYPSLTCTEGKKCGHYTQVVWADSYKIGCSLTMCDYVSDFNQPNSHLFICNYSPAGNVHTLGPKGSATMLKPFLKGKSCSNCRTPSDVCRKKLCANAIRDKSVPAPFHPDPGNSLETTSCTGLVVAVVILSLTIVVLLAITVYRESVRNSNAFQGWAIGRQADHSKFSNQNTPLPSRSNTPRQSIVISSLHGNSRLTDANGRLSISAPVPVKPSKPSKPARPLSKDMQRVFEKKSYSVPNSPHRPARPPPPSGTCV